MLAPELLAAMASGCWAIGALFSANAASQMGAFAFTRWRLFFAMCLLWIAAMYVGRWPELTFESIAWLSVSSWIGILVGDTALFVCMNRLGPRRSGVLFATHALFLLYWLGCSWVNPCGAGRSWAVAFWCLGSWWPLCGADVKKKLTFGKIPVAPFGWAWQWDSWRLWVKLLPPS